MLKTHEVEQIRSEGGEAAVQEAIREDRKKSDEEKKQKARRENRDFTQVYPAGWQRLRELMKIDPSAANVYAFFAEQMGPDGTLCASRSTIAAALQIGERTVSRHVRTLEENGAIVVLKIGTANVYCLNPAEVWKSFDNAKPYAAFKTHTLVGKAENPFVKRRLATLLGGKEPEQKDLFKEPEDAFATAPAEDEGAADLMPSSDWKIGEPDPHFRD